MNSNLLKRLFRAINQDNVDAINKLALMIIEEEKDKGHGKLAEQLETLLRAKTRRAKVLKEATNNKILSLIDNSDKKNPLIELPTSKRGEYPLFSFIEHDKLRHQMVLPENVEEKFLKIEKEYAAQDRLMRYHLKPIKKILLYGEPGCGKTMSAERLAWNIGMPLLKVRFDSLLSSFFGESAANLRTVFETSMNVPCVLLIDECDFIATARNSKRDIGEASRVVNMFLQLLDEYEPIGLIVATTNIQSSLDKALFRRFDESFELHKPEVKEIKRLLKTSLSAMQTSNDINWEEVSQKMEGLSYAEIVRIAQNSAKSIVMESKHHISNDDILNAISNIKINN